MRTVLDFLTLARTDPAGFESTCELLAAFAGDSMNRTRSQRAWAELDQAHEAQRILREERAASGLPVDEDQ